MHSELEALMNQVEAALRWKRHYGLQYARCAADQTQAADLREIISAFDRKLRDLHTRILSIQTYDRPV